MYAFGRYYSVYLTKTKWSSNMEFLSVYSKYLVSLKVRNVIYSKKKNTTKKNIWNMHNHIMFWLLILITSACFTNCEDIEVSCGESLFTENVGMIKSPQISKESKSTVDCTYDIKLSTKERWLRLSWDSFDLIGKMPDCSDEEYVMVYSG